MWYIVLSINQLYSLTYLLSCALKLNDDDDDDDMKLVSKVSKT